MAKLISKITGKEVKAGDILTDFRGDTTVLKSFTEPHKPSSTGKVYVEGGLTGYYPSVYDLEIVNHEFSEKKVTELKQIGDKIYLGVIGR
jgi:hypothetical protein